MRYLIGITGPHHQMWTGRWQDHQPVMVDVEEYWLVEYIDISSGQTRVRCRRFPTRSQAVIYSAGMPLYGLVSLTPRGVDRG